jgi:nitrogen fixation protein FixH
MIKRFSGWHMTAILVVFFGVVVAVNFPIAHYTISTFGVTVAENGFVGSRNYDR